MHTSATRTCVGCGARDAQSALLRLQLHGDDGLHAVARPSAGRSAYLHASKSCLEALAKSRLIKRSLRRDIDRTARAATIARLRASLAGSALPDRPPALK